MSEFEPIPALPPLQTEQPSDLLLLAFVESVEKGVITSMSLTVNVDGALISGLLVSRPTWFTELAATTSGFGGELIAEIGAILDRQEPEDDEGEAPGFLHLQDAAVVSGGKPVPLGYWRCRVADVSAWSFSTIK